MSLVSLVSLVFFIPGDHGEEPLHEVFQIRVERGARAAILEQDRVRLALYNPLQVLYHQLRRRRGPQRGRIAVGDAQGHDGVVEELKNMAVDKDRLLAEMSIPTCGHT